jgi:3-oxoacyl-[acyl-carrier-protein] synthase III
MLVRPADEREGFVDFAFETFTEAEGTFESAISWREKKLHLPLSRPGKNVLKVVQGDGYECRAIECAEQAVRGFLARHEIRASTVDLAIFSQSPPGFADGLATRLELGQARVARVARELRGAHTASPIAALDAAIESGQFAAATTILFAAVGAGIVVGLALYRK